MSVVRNVYFDQNGLHFEARPGTIGTDPDELELLISMSHTPARDARLACLQQNVRHACEMLLMAETVGRA